MFLSFADWIAGTRLSALFGGTAWVVPCSQSIHILAIGLLFACTLLLNLRVLGFVRLGATPGGFAAQLAPWMWRALALLALTGTVQTIAEPRRQFVAAAFWAKMAMLLLVVSLTLAFLRVARRDAAAWDTGGVPARARLFAMASTLLWCAIIVCGRLIGYTYTGNT